MPTESDRIRAETKGALDRQSFITSPSTPGTPDIPIAALQTEKLKGDSGLANRAAELNDVEEATRLVEEQTIDVPPFYKLKNYGELVRFKQLAESDKSPPNKKASIMRSIRAFVQENQEQLPQMKQDYDASEWKKENIESSPMVSTRLITAQNEAMKARRSEGLAYAYTGGRAGGGNVPLPMTVADLPYASPDSREGIIQRMESEGVNTTGGIGDFGDNMAMAVKLNGSQAQAAAITGVVMDDLEQAGIKLPEGVRPIYVNEELQQLEALVPTEDGKVRRTLVEPEFFNVNSLGQLADLEEAFAGIYAATAEFRGLGRTASVAKHPFIRELTGDIAGRNVGIMLEAIIGIPGGSTTLDDVAEAFSPTENLWDSMTNTATSRTMIRTGRYIKGKFVGKNRLAGMTSGSETIDDVAENVAESKKALEEVNTILADDIADGSVLPVTIESGSFSAKEAQRTNSRARRISSANADNLELIRRERIKSQGVAAQRVAERNAPAADPTYRPDSDPVIDVGDATKLVNKHRASVGDVDVQRPPPGQGFANTKRYTFVGEGAEQADTGAGTLQGNVGIDVDFYPEHVVIRNAFAGKEFAGSQERLFTRVLDDAQGAGLEVFTDATMSPSALKAVAARERRGYAFELHADVTQKQVDDAIEKGTVITTPDGAPLYRLRSRPGEIVAPREVADAKFDRQVFEAELDEVGDLLPAAQMRAEQANAFLKESIGWSEQKQISGYTVVNPANSGVRKSIRRITNRRDNALTGTEVSAADQKLVAMVRKAKDEEGGEYLTGLNDEALDLGNLLTARESINRMAKESGDPDLIQLVKEIDNLAKNGTVLNRGSGRAVPARRAAINESIQRARGAQDTADHISATLMASKMFKKNVNGEYVNTSIDGLATVLKDGPYMTHMKPVLDAAPDLQLQAREALSTLYNQKVLGGSGFTPTKLDNFLRNYDTALRSAFSEAEYRNLASVAPPTGGMSRIEKSRQRQDRMWEETRARLVPDQSPITITNPSDIIGSLNSNTVGPTRAKLFMQDLDRLDPRLAARVRQEAIEQTQQQLHRKFFDVTQDTSNLSTGIKLRDWFTDNRKVLEAVHGPEYVRELNSVVKAAEMDARRAIVKGKLPETQHDVIRVTRSLLGPLSRPQRQITAANYVNQKRLALQVMNIYSDPKQLDLLLSSSQIPDGLSARSQAGIALMTRLGVFEAVGIPTPNDLNDPAFQEQVSALYDQMDSWVDERFADTEDE
jgi:hypothetical protein